MALNWAKAHEDSVSVTLDLSRGLQYTIKTWGFSPKSIDDIK